MGGDSTSSDDDVCSDISHENKNASDTKEKMGLDDKKKKK
jgi:hypothetical protein